MEAKGFLSLRNNWRTSWCTCKTGVVTTSIRHPSHVIVQILEALPIAVERGLEVPLVYNTGGYDRVSALKLLDGVVDIYMPDFKFWDPGWPLSFAMRPTTRNGLETPA